MGLPNRYVPRVMTYRCTGFHRHEFEVLVPAPLPGANWPVHSNPDWKKECPQCGCFGVPAGLAPPGVLVDEHMHFMFARCPNAWHCAGYDKYDGDCEKGQVMPKCFYALHARLEALEDRLERREASNG